MSDKRVFSQTQERWKRIVETDVFKRNLEKSRKDKSVISSAIAETRHILDLSPFWEIPHLYMSFWHGRPFSGMPAGGLAKYVKTDAPTGFEQIKGYYEFPETTKRDILSFHKFWTEYKKNTVGLILPDQTSAIYALDETTGNYYFCIIPGKKGASKNLLLKFHSRISNYYEQNGQKKYKRLSKRHAIEFLAKELREQKIGTGRDIAKIINESGLYPERIAFFEIPHLVRSAKKKQKNI